MNDSLSSRAHIWSGNVNVDKGPKRNQEWHKEPWKLVCLELRSEIDGQINGFDNKRKSLVAWKAQHLQSGAGLDPLQEGPTNFGLRFSYDIVKDIVYIKQVIYWSLVWTT